MSIQELYTTNARVWIPDKDLVWLGAVLLEDYTGQKELRILRDDGEEVVHKLIKGRDKKAVPVLPPLRNPDILIGQNDLTTMSYLNEPEVLYNLQVRFCDRREIYTYCGIVLVAINPYEELPIYGNEIIYAYHGQDLASLDPHIFAVAEEAYKNLARFDENQSVIVSGESGAGKTVSAKYTMRYFATVGGAEDETQVERRVLASNPVTEAFGNAKTTRNDNSSRFGKYLEIAFSRRTTKIVGASMRTYLLEKSRVVFQSAGERNYHIFYQLCASRELPELSDMGLLDADSFFYTGQGDSPEVNGVDDVEELVATREAFELLGVPESSQLIIFQILAGILHMGNIQFKDGDRSDTVSLPKNDKHLSAMCRLLGCNEEQMRTWLCVRSITTVHETLRKPLTREEAGNARDALAKHIYARIFDWIITKINWALGGQTSLTGGGGVVSGLVGNQTQKNQPVNKFIGVLDIYGFETFEVNSFEQFCINYANEKLQQQFNMHVFKLEQEEYVKEEIQWSFIDFYDNQPCIDLIENKLGILDLLDEECRMPKGSDQNWCEKLYQKHLGKAVHFEKPKMSNSAFIIQHFADTVEYSITGFLEKNRDTVLEEQINLLKASDVELVSELFLEPGEESRPAPTNFKITTTKQPRGGNKQMKKTVGSQFRESLKLLMTTLNATTPHYIRCIKPNDLKLPFTFCPVRADQQLRACGVLETIRISSAGFPSRWSYNEFLIRYRLLVSWKLIKWNDLKGTSQTIVTAVIKDEDKYRFGSTKLFFRAGQVAYLEKLRSDRLRWAGMTIQRHVRGFLARRRYTKMRRTILLCQTWGRGMLARRQMRFLRETKAAKRIQTWYRGRYQRRRFHLLRRSCVVIQTCWRRILARRLRFKLRYEKDVVICQAVVRGFLARRRYWKIYRGIVLVQSHFRRRKAREELRHLKVEARSIDHIKKVNTGLENKIIELQQRLDDRAREMTVYREDQSRLQRLSVDLSRFQRIEEDNKSLGSRIADLEAEVARLKRELLREKTEKEALVAEREKTKMEHAELVSGLQEEKLNMTALVEKTEYELAQKATEMSRMREEFAALQRSDDDFSGERAHHQHLVSDYARLEQKYENLCREYAFLKTEDGADRGEEEDEESSEESEEEEAQDEDEFDTDVRYRSRSEIVNKSEKNNTFLLLTLQKKTDLLERENRRLKDELEHIQDRSTNGHQDNEKRDVSRNESYFSLLSQELEIDNSRLKKQLEMVNQAVAKGEGEKAILNQLEASRAELENRREECLQLKSVLSSKQRTMVTNQYGGDSNQLNEDGEVFEALETQKDVNRRLLTELETVLKEKTKVEEEYKKELAELKKELDRQQRLIGQLGDVLGNMSLSSDEKLDACMQNEITRLTAENIDLREANDRADGSIRQLKRAVKYYAHKLQKHEGSVPDTNHHEALMQAAEAEMGMTEAGLPTKKEQEESQGMVSYRKQDENAFIKALIYELEPRQAVTMLPGLPAYLIFMAVRYADLKNEDEKVQTLLTNVITAIRHVVKKRHKQLDYLCLWLSNSSRLLHCLKQYSGEKAFQSENTNRQNQQCLRHFDLSAFRQTLNDLNVWIYQTVIKHAQDNLISPSVLVAGVLEHEGITGLSGSVAGGQTGQKRVPGSQSDPVAENKLDLVVKMLNIIYTDLTAHAVDPDLVNQVFCQLFYWLSAQCLNNLLLRKELCNWARGMQIKYNLSHLENWIRDKNLIRSGALEWLEPLVQASQLLQAKKSEDNAETITGMCNKLSIPQVVKLLNLYNPIDGYEERVPVAFIRCIQSRLQEVRKNELEQPPGAIDPSIISSATIGQSQTLMLNTKATFAVKFGFHPSSVALETVRMPDNLNLSFLQRY